MRGGRLIVAARHVGFAALFTAFLATPATAQNNVSDGLKQAGLAALPTFLNAATNSITLHFPAALGGGTLSFGGTVDAKALTEKKFVFTTSDQHKLSWNNAFGMSWLSLSDVALNLSFASGAFSIQLDGKTGGALGQHQVIASIDASGGKLNDFRFELPKVSLALSQLPGFGSLPGASDFKLQDPYIAKDTLGGKLAFHGETVDAMVFDSGSQTWALALKMEKPLSLGMLVNHNSGLLSKVALPRMTLLVAAKDASKAYSDLPPTAGAFFITGGKLPGGNLALRNGASILSAPFDPSALPSEIRTAISKIGLNSKIDITGAIDGAFGGGVPNIKLGAPIAPPGSRGFDLLKTSSGARHDFFIKLNKDEQTLGFATSVDLPGAKGKPPLTFDVAFEISEQKTGIELLVAGDMRGDWHDALGIGGLTLQNPFLSVGINATGAFELMIDGTIMVGSEKVRGAIDLVLQPAEAFAPEAAALAGTVNKISFKSLNDHASKSGSLKGGGVNVDAQLQDVAFAFMTPGARLPADLEKRLKLKGAGMALDGKLFLDNKEVGAATGYASTAGLYFDGKLTNLKAGPLDLKNAELMVQAGPSVDPSFMMQGDFALFKGFDEAYKLALSPAHFEFSSETKFGGAFDAALTAESDGLKLEPGNDFAFTATLAAKYNKMFQDVLNDALKGLKQGDKDIAKAEDDVKKAEAKVAGLNKDIAAARQEAEESYKKAAAGLGDAEKKVNELNDQINSLKKKIHDLQQDINKEKKDLRLDLAAKHGVELGEKEAELGGLEAAKKTADWALDTAQKAAKGVPAGASPKVVALQTQLGTEEAGLKTAQGVLEVARAADKGLEAATKAVLNASADFKINSLGASGSLLGITSDGKQGKKPMLVIDCTIKNSRHVFREPIDSLKNEFPKLAELVAKDVAKALVDAFK